jgi:hypothetical protein
MGQSVLFFLALNATFSLQPDAVRLLFGEGRRLAQFQLTSGLGLNDSHRLATLEALRILCPLVLVCMNLTLNLIPIALPKIVRLSSISFIGPMSSVDSV